MKRVVVGTAGHIDHGKTSLVRALTGIDTDRLREEKRRGITIELGFAHLPLPDGTVAGVVDVPGHERFVRAMAAGAGGIDLVVLVIAADEGVMPQTREHLDICRLLGVPRGLVAVTKSDLLPELGTDWLPLLEQDVREVTRGTFLEGAAIVPVSAATGEGLDELRAGLGRLAAEVQERPADGPVFLPIDRAFSMKGFGTVVTGTLLSGQIAEGDEAALLPSAPGAPALRVRSVQVHGKPAARALAGQRTAVNLPGVEPAAIQRGQALVHAGVVPQSSMLDVEVTLLAAAPRPLRHRAKLLLHVGTAQVPAAVALVDRGELRPGETAFAQLRLGQPVAALPGQRFILRGFTVLQGRGKTLAGGRVLAVAAPRRRRGRPEGLRQLEVLARGEPDARVATVLEMSGPAGLELGGLVGRTALSPKAAQTALDRLGAKGGALLFDRERRAYVAGTVAQELAQRLLAAVDAFHAERPLAAGVGREELRGRLPPVTDPRLFQRLLAQLADRGELVLEGDHVRRKGHAAASGADAGALKEKVAQALSKGGLTPAWLAELPPLVGGSPADVQAVLKLLLAEGRVVRASSELWFDGAAVAALRERLVAFLRERREITTQEFKELVGATRKHVIPLAEYFDREKVTLRVGEKRVLRGEGRG
ncbi:selenocysteine-specific translation elongation factor [Anaeromyxobacter sp. Fw109-5]|uniref:selenocysteine-specific translation elongation factor n=1 Tax=Anaeromyxobacter sp. (strain Fw109-5) TaxID=404589 RepID=UPI0000ED6D9D|nr:selenocysteine-specific translation elongation factor [Anaeromyxobacter sp. Fw109-5]ABS28328.1 selenocysteine-specific translation elongation factor [Anaeromyxobacter sp. Fw109-5]